MKNDTILKVYMKNLFYAGLYWNYIWNDMSIKEEIIQCYHRDSISSDDPIVIAKKAKVSLCLGDTVKAEHRLKRSLEILPNLSRPWFYLGIISFARDKNRKQAVEYFEKSIVLSNKDFQAEKYKERLVQTGMLDISDFNNISYFPDFSQLYATKFNTWYDSFTIDKILFHKECDN